MIDLDSLPPVRAGDLGDGVVDLWCFFYEDADLARYREWLTDEERARLSRFVFERDRTMFLATRTLVRSALSTYAPIAPEAWRFSIGEHGKPRADGVDLEMNLSNTEGLVVCAVSRAVVGVDAERIGAMPDIDAVAPLVFSPRERAELAATPDDARAVRFARTWTLKEAYVKARGAGLSLPLERFTVTEDEPIRIAFDAGFDDDPRRWRFASIRASARHLVAVAVDARGAPVEVRAKRFLPR